MTHAQTKRRKVQIIQLIGFALFSTLFTACASEQMTCPDSSELNHTESLREALAQYSEGWAARDTDAILARHTDDSEFHLITQGSLPAKGKAEIRATFDAIFASNPNYKSTVRSIRLGGDFAVVEYDIHMDPNRATQAGVSIFTPSGKGYMAPAVDIIVFDNGLVTRKVTYIDSETVRANSLKVERVQP